MLTVPGDVMKIKDKPHRVPLCRQAMELIEGLRALNGDTPFIFASPDRTRAPITPNAVLNTFRRTGFAGVQTTHGVRTIFSTLINETREEGLHSFSSDLAELQIAHTLPKVRAAYMRSDYLEPRRVMLQWFADYLDALRA